MTVSWAWVLIAGATLGALLLVVVHPRARYKYATACMILLATAATLFALGGEWLIYIPLVATALLIVARVDALRTRRRPS